MMNKKVVRIIALVLAGLMVLTCLSVLLYVYAADGAVPVAAAIAPSTGDSTGGYIAAGVIGGLALVAVVACVIVPKLKKKNVE